MRLFCFWVLALSNFDLSNGCSVCSREPGDCFVHLLKGGARRAGEKTPFFFLQSFFFWGYLLKRKSVKGILVSINSATNYRYQDFLAAFLCRKRRKEKLTKETPSALTPRRRHYSWRATYKKVDKTIAQCAMRTPR